MIAVTPEPTPPEMVLIFVFEPELVMVPLIATEAVVMLTDLLNASPKKVRLPVPVKPPLIVRSAFEFVALYKVRSLFKVTEPLSPVALPTAIVRPPDPEATVIAFAASPMLKKFKFNRASAAPSATPSEIEPAPNAVMFVAPDTVPALIVSPPVKVFAPVKLTELPALSTSIAVVPVAPPLLMTPVSELAPEPDSVSFTGATLPTLEIAAVTDSELLELLDQIWLPSSRTVPEVNATAPELARMAIPPKPMVRVRVEDLVSVEAAVAVTPSPNRRP